MSAMVGREPEGNGPASMTTAPEDFALTDTQFGSTPSRETTATPGWVRLAGTVGAVCFAAGLAMYVTNIAVELRHPLADRLPTDKPWMFRPALVTLFHIVGLLGLLIQAGRERDEQPRRMLGVLGAVFFALGALFLTNVLASEGVKQWLVAGGEYSPDVAGGRGKWAGMAATLVMALILLAAWVAPFVRAAAGQSLSLGGMLRRWVTHLGEPRVAAMTLYGAIGLGVIAVIAYLIKQPLYRYSGDVLMYTPENRVPYGLGAFGFGFLLVGLPFLLIFSRTEEDTAWARVPGSLLFTVGGLASFFGLVGFYTDLLGIPDFTSPYSLALSSLGLVLLCLYVTQRRTESDMGYSVAKWMGFAGLVVFVVAAVRSVLPSVVEIGWVQDTFAALENVSLPSYLVPNGFFYLALGAAFAFFGWTLSSDRPVFVLTRKELGGFFTSAIGYIVIGGTVVVSWAVFWQWLNLLARATLESGGMGEPVVQEYVASIFMIIFLMIAIPMLTMRLLSEEHRGGTLEVLLTAPVDEVSVVVSKFAAAWLFYLVMMLIWCSFPLILRIAGQESFDYRPLLSGLLGLAVIGFNFIAMGVFFSGLTRNQIVAFLLTFAGILLQLMLVVLQYVMFSGRNAPTSSTLLEAIRYASWYEHMLAFSSGKVFFKHILFHVTLGVFWLFLTVRVLESRKWR